MNVSGIFKDENQLKKYRQKLNQLEGTKSMFAEFTKRMNESEAARKKAEGKKKKRSGVMVTGATSKEDIRRLQRILRQKVAEVLAEDGDMKLKQLQVNDLMRKLDSLGRILSDIERLEREQLSGRNRQKTKKGATDAVYLTSENLTVNKSGLIDLSVAGFGKGPGPSGVDVLAGADVSVNAADAQIMVDMQA